MSTKNVLDSWENLPEIILEETVKNSTTDVNLITSVVCKRWRDVIYPELLRSVKIHRQNLFDQQFYNKLVKYGKYVTYLTVDLGDVFNLQENANFFNKLITSCLNLKETEVIFDIDLNTESSSRLLDVVYSTVTRGDITLIDFNETLSSIPPTDILELGSLNRITSLIIGRNNDIPNNLTQIFQNMVSLNSLTSIVNENVVEALKESNRLYQLRAWDILDIHLPIPENLNLHLNTTNNLNFLTLNCDSRTYTRNLLLNFNQSIVQFCFKDNGAIQSQDFLTYFIGRQDLQGFSLLCSNFYDLNVVHLTLHCPTLRLLTLTNTYVSTSGLNTILTELPDLNSLDIMLGYIHPAGPDIKEFNLDFNRLPKLEKLTLRCDSQTLLSLLPLITHLNSLIEMKLETPHFTPESNYEHVLSQLSDFFKTTNPKFSLLKLDLELNYYFQIHKLGPNQIFYSFKKFSKADPIYLIKNIKIAFPSLLSLKLRYGEKTQEYFNCIQNSKLYYPTVITLYPFE